jgi:hypothetical protein
MILGEFQFRHQKHTTKHKAWPATKTKRKP